MTTAPLVSVLMPSLNQSQFIEAAVRSAFQPDFRQLELIVADGGSSDGTLAVLERLALEFAPRLRWVSLPDRGPADAVNRALSLAHAAIVGWLNADDLYAPGAIAAAVQRLSADPTLVMIYGEAQHIDAEGHHLGRYPTLSPAAGIDAFQSSCFICQPTVLLRREALEQLGGLDDSCAVAFDFDLWIRLFARFPSRIGFIDRLQAFSRTHGQTLTARQRRRVAFEAVRVLAKHLGHAQPHWILTYLDETIRGYPTYDQNQDLRAHAMNMFEDVATHLNQEGRSQLLERIEHDKRLTCVSAGVHADFFADGWAGKSLALRLRCNAPGDSVLVVRGDNRAPVSRHLRLDVTTSDGTSMSVAVKRRQTFQFEVPFHVHSTGQLLFARVECAPTFVPMHVERDSVDTRTLAYKVDSISLTDARHYRYSQG